MPHLPHCPACQQTVFKSFKTLHCVLRQSNIMALGILIFTEACSAHVFQVGVCKTSLLRTLSFTLNQKVNGSIFQHV